MNKQEKKAFTKSVTDSLKERATKNVSMTEQEQEQAKIMLEQGSKSVVLKDEDFTLGVQELDIRNLSKKNKDQLIFRLQATNTTLLHQIAQIEQNNAQFLMLILKKLGVDPKDLTKELTSVQVELVKTVQEEVAGKEQKA